MKTDNVLAKSIQYIKGVGPRKALLMKKLGIETVRDALYYFPKDWEDRSRQYNFDELVSGLKVTLKVQIKYARQRQIGKRLGVFEAAAAYQGNIINALWYRNVSARYDVFATLKKRIVPGASVFIYGMIERDFAQALMKVEEYSAGEAAEESARGIMPHYALTEGMDRKYFRNIVRDVVNEYADAVKENIPEAVRISMGLIGKKEAVKNIHFPEDLNVKEQARKRLVYEEFFFLEYALMLSKIRKQRERRHEMYRLERKYLTPFKNSLGFGFTQAQKKVIKEIFDDMLGGRPMNRLLQGDVGSGKTVVALSAMLLAAENGRQSVFMAPTEILADQHYITMKNYLGFLPVKTALLTSSVPGRQKNEILRKLENGGIDIIVGTQALIQKKVKFKKLSLVVVDEQHRFGVVQRESLLKKSGGFAGATPDVLVMTATPIPRTLALTVYGDLDISVLDELPPGRKKISTLHLDRGKAYEMINSELKKGGQAYIVYPLVEESDKLELKSAVKEAEVLSKEVFSEYSVGLLHGQMPGHQKEKVMKDFLNHSIDILFSTTVIEVGIDVPNASVMAIENAGRFGLATLHQLRGRVGRGGRESYCILLGRPETILAKERLKAILASDSGFKLGEIDLALRGPGEFFGVSQHGMPELKIANIISDSDLLEKARADVERILSGMLNLEEKDAVVISDFFREEYGKKFNLINVG